MGKGLGIWVTLAAMIWPSVGVAQTRAVPGGLPLRKPTTLPLPGGPGLNGYTDGCLVALAPNNHFYAVQQDRVANVWAVMVYCWPEAAGAIALLLALKLFRSMRRYRRLRRIEPHCEKCDYCLVGLTSDRCPECGEPVSANRRRSRRFLSFFTAIYALVIASLVCTYPLLRWQRVERCPHLPAWATWWSAPAAQYLSQYCPGTHIENALVQHGERIVECGVDGKVAREFGVVIAFIGDIRLSFDGSILMTPLHSYDMHGIWSPLLPRVLWDVKSGRQISILETPGRAEHPDSSGYEYEIPQRFRTDGRRVYGHRRARHGSSWQISDAQRDKPITDEVETVCWDMETGKCLGPVPPVEQQPSEKAPALPPRDFEYAKGYCLPATSKDRRLFACPLSHTEAFTPLTIGVYDSKSLQLLAVLDVDVPDVPGPGSWAYWDSHWTRRIMFSDDGRYLYALSRWEVLSFDLSDIVK